MTALHTPRQGEQASLRSRSKVCLRLSTLAFAALAAYANVTLTFHQKNQEEDGLPTTAEVIKKVATPYPYNFTGIPNILIAGTQKAGTTTLAYYLMKYARHLCYSDPRRAIMENGKESHFFDKADPGGVDDLLDLYKHCNASSDILIDATPNTMVVPQRVHDIYQRHGRGPPDKIIFTLREPVSREISWYNHRRRTLETTPHHPPAWARAIQLDGDASLLMSFRKVMISSVIRNFLQQKYSVMTSYYAHHLKTWFELFDRQRILVLSYDEIKRNPERYLQRVHDFLQLPSMELHPLPHENTNSKHYPDPLCKVQRELASFFEEPNEELYALLEDNPGTDIEQRPFPKFQFNAKCAATNGTESTKGTRVSALSRFNVYKLSSHELRNPAKYLPHKFRTSDDQCRNDLLECKYIYDAECFHRCEAKYFHQLESCLIPMYSLLKHAVNQSNTTTNDGEPVCISYDANGYLTSSKIETLTQAWGTAASKLRFIPYHGQRQMTWDQCWKEPKPGAIRGVPEAQPICFNIKSGAQVQLSLDKCGGACRATSLAASLQDLQRDLKIVWGDFIQPRKDTVVLIDRNESDARAFANSTAFEQALHAKFQNVLIYRGQFPTFSRELAYMFGSAGSIVHYHGAGAVNVIFSSASTVVMELFHSLCPRDNEYLKFGDRLQALGYPCWSRLFAGTPLGVPQGSKPCKYARHVAYNQSEVDLISETVSIQVQHNNDNNATMCQPWAPAMI
mmetsp:Transcript_13387/g.36915  ORF Transcript_13387/g.36915 Transcript_13387/m.36915 type:complete len:736 (-) Transcript_13387:113-2320(-)